MFLFFFFCFISIYKIPVGQILVLFVSFVVIVWWFWFNDHLLEFVLCFALRFQGLWFPKLCSYGSNVSSKRSKIEAKHQQQDLK